MPVNGRRKTRPAIICLVASLVSSLALQVKPVFSAERFVEDIRVSRVGPVAEVIIQFACPMRSVSDVAMRSGLEVEIRLSLLQGCSDLGLPSDNSSELLRPANGPLAHLMEVEFESLGVGDNLLALRFDRPVSYRVSQLGDLSSLRLQVDPAGSATAERAPVLRVRKPETATDYVINLQSTRDPIDTRLITIPVTDPGQKIYVSEATLDGEIWYRLRLGFFASEAAAREVLTSFGDQFPRAWVGRADADEIRLATSSGSSAEDLSIGVTAADTSRAVSAAPLGTSSGSGGPETLSVLMIDAREATLDQDYEAAIRIYTRLLLEPGDHRSQAREFLGVSREKNGQIAHAIAEYRRYLEDYPESEGNERVRQRLSGLLTAAAAPREPLRPTDEPSSSNWKLSSGVSQYYRRNVTQFDGGEDDIVALSALMTDVDLSIRRTGGSLDIASRIAMSHFYDLLGEDDNGPGDQNRLSYAYLDVADPLRGWSARVGRQRRQNSGVLGRFDGAHLGYEWRPARRVHLTMGYPVATTRDSVKSDRQFHGVAVEFDDLIQGWTFGAFFNEQSIEGIAARSATGFEVNYQDEYRSLTGMLDYDIDFGELNTLLTLGTWRLRNRITLTGLIDIRQSPVLTTRNALIGQPVTTIEELLLVWTEEELRQLAIDRTAGIQTVTLGIASPIGEKFQINADVTVTEMEGTIASGGVSAVPGTGQQVFYSTSVVGSGLFGARDVNVFSLRRGESDSFSSTYLAWDARFPIGSRVRLNPRLRFAIREELRNGSKRETISPSLRLLFNSRNRYRFELELGRDGLTRTGSNGAVESSGYYINLGYRASF